MDEFIVTQLDGYCNKTAIVIMDRKTPVRLWNLTGVGCLTAADPAAAAEKLEDIAQAQ
jgi:hypothetical protein